MATVQDMAQKANRNKNTITDKDYTFRDKSNPKDKRNSLNITPKEEKNTKNSKGTTEGEA